MKLGRHHVLYCPFGLYRPNLNSNNLIIINTEEKNTIYGVGGMQRCRYDSNYTSKFPSSWSLGITRRKLWRIWRVWEFFFSCKIFVELSSTENILTNNTNHMWYYCKTSLQTKIYTQWYKITWNGCRSSFETLPPVSCLIRRSLYDNDYNSKWLTVRFVLC